MNGPLFHRKYRLAHCFGNGRMSMNDIGQRLYCHLQAYCQRCFGNEIGSPWAYDVNTKDFLVFFPRNDLDHALSAVHDQSLAICGQRKLSNQDVKTSCFGLFFGQTDSSKLWCGVYAVRNGIVPENCMISHGVFCSNLGSVPTYVQKSRQ